MTEHDFKGQVVVLTGASSGIGRALASAFARREAVLHLIARDDSRLSAIIRECRELGASSALAHQIDFLDDSDAEGGVEDLARALSRVDILIHCAGVCTLGPVQTAPLEDLDKNYRVNLRAPVLLTRALLPKLLSVKGQVVFVNSGAGLNAGPNWAHYAASKHGLKAIADSLRAEVSGQGVRVMSVYPGRTATPMQESVRRMEGQPYDPETFIQPKDVSDMMLQALALPKTGMVIDLNIRPGAR